MMKQHRERRMMELTRRQPFRHMRLRQALFLIMALGACFLMIYTVHVLRPTPLVIKLHSSAERFVEESLHEIVLLPEKLDPLKRDDLSLKQKCALLKLREIKRKAHSRDNAGEETREGRQQGEQRAVESEEEQQHNGGSKRKDDKGGLEEVDLPVKEIWPARRRDWKDNEEIQRLKRLLFSNALFRRNIDLMNVKIPPRQPSYKTPCYLMNPRELTQCRAGPFKNWARFKKGHNQKVGDKKKPQLSCLPYFIVAGVPQGGAVDVLQLLSRHPDVTVPLPVQSRWFESVRFEDSCGSLDAYLDFFGSVTQTVNASVAREGYHTIVAGEVAEDILWNNNMWPVLPGNEGQLEPRYTNADYLHHIDPDVKVIVILRDPTERLYEEYLADHERFKYVPSAEDFNTRVTYKMDVLRTCLHSEPLRTCVYDAVQDSSDKAVRLRSGMYHVMLQDWLRVFPRRQVHVISYKTFFTHMKEELGRLIKFLKLREVSATDMDKMVQMTVERREKKANRTEGMLIGTRHLLDNFYRPLNKLLATLLEDQSFLWAE